MKQIQSQINHQLIGSIPFQMSSPYRTANGVVLAFQNSFQLTKDQFHYDFKILTPQQLKNNRTTQMFNWDVNFTESTLKQFTNDEFYSIYQFNCFLLGDCYKSNSLQYIQQKYRTFSSYFEKENNARINLLILGPNLSSYNDFKLKNTLQNPFSDLKRIYVNQKNPFVTFAAYDIVESDQPAITFFNKLIQHGAFQDLDEACQYYGVCAQQLSLINVHQLFQSEELQPGNMVAFRSNYREYYQQIAFCSYTLHINQYHKNVPNNEFSLNLCEQCNSGKQDLYCTCLKSQQPLKQPQLIPTTYLQEYPLDYQVYDIVCSLYHSLICQSKIWSYQDSIENIINSPINEEAIITSQANSYKNYENLELLGDAVLKYVVTVELFQTYDNLNEGEMTSLRSRIIMNTFLAQLFEQQGLQNYIINQDLHFKQIRNPLANDIKQSEDPQLQISQMADIYEALVGGVFEKTQNLYEFIALLRQTNFPISSQRDSLLDFEQLFDKNESLEFQNYKFKNSQLLELALDRQRYDRLEFLGDAAFELLVISYLFKIARLKQQQNQTWKLTPGLLSNWKQNLLSNKFMGELAIKIGLLPPTEEITKLYGDIFESVGAAILIDSGWTGFNRVFGTLYKPYIDQLIE